MPIVAGDWEVTRSNGNIRYIGGNHQTSPTYATVIEFHRWVQGLADDATSTGDDEVDVTDELPSARSTDNIIRLLGSYNIDDLSAEHLYDGSIIQGAGGTEVFYDGIVNFGNADVQIQVIQNGAVVAADFWNEAGVGLNADAAQGISHRFLIKTRTAGADVDGRRLIGTSRTFGNTYAEFSINGTSRGNNVFALVDANDLNNETVEATVATWTTIANVTEGFKLLDVDNNASDEEYYSEWNKDTFSINQFFERMKWLTRDGSASTLYGLNGELYRGITHEIVVDTPTGTFNAFEAVSWTGGTGQMLAINSTTAATKMWIQLLTGVAPTDGLTITGGGSSATVDVNATVTDRSALISKPFIGASTGSAIIGAYGVGIETADLSATDKVFDLGNAQVLPPNNVTYTAGGLIHGEDRIIVGPWDGAALDGEGNPALDKAQLTLSTSLTTDNITAVVVTTAIPSDTPSTGTIRVTDNNGFDRRLEYSSWASSTFTISSTDGQEDFATVQATNPKDVYITYLDELADGSLITAGSFVTGVTYVIKTTGTTDFTLIGAADSDPGTVFTATGAGTGTGDANEQSATAAFTGVYSSDRDLVAIVRDGGISPIKQFISSTKFVSSNSGITAIRTTDA